MPTCKLHRLIVVAFLVVSFSVQHNAILSAQGTAYDTPEAAARDESFTVQGEYAGDKLGLHVIALGDGEFDLVVYQGGLPGDGWDRQKPQKLDGDAEVVKQFIQARGLKRVERQSPTLGAKPPANAVVLFDGTQASLDKNWAGAKRTADGLLIQGAMTKDKFKDYSLHIEFRTPYQPMARGQGRGNSGVYHQGRYETQVLDSFGLEGKNNESGGIYEIRDPDLNMCFPPLAWQTYDVDFVAARFDDSGKKISNARLTVRLNGVEVQRDVAIPNPTRAAPVQETAEPGPIYLQDHGNPVRYRNIWLVPRDAEKDARRPRIPGFERFFAGQSSSASKPLGGQLLISQLGCTACHASETPTLANRTAPNLQQVGTRIRRDHLLNYILQPHSTKSGTAMPDLLHGYASDERQKIAEAIASYLASTGRLIDRSGDSGAARRGEEQFHTIGCSMCHAARRGENNFETTSVPLGDLTSKYTLDSLSKFLMDPHAVRSSGLMPKLTSDMSEARDLACYLLGEQIIVPGAEQFQATVYYGSWDRLPDFETLKVERKGTTNGLDLSIARRRDDFAIRFETFLPVNIAGEYVFHLGSDDGSRLVIDDQEVVNVDGIHPVQMKTGRVKLTSGVHRLRIDYFEKGGGEEIVLDVEGPDFGRTPIAGLVTADPNGNASQEIIKSKFQPNPELVGYGKEMFNSVGCAKCHAMESALDKAVSPTAIKLSALRPGAGCLAQQVPKGLPNYDLSDRQKDAIHAVLASLNKEVTAPQKLHLQLAGNNCYACHSRNSSGDTEGELRGEPELARDSFFLTRMQEMGNEGRVPPPLTGAGDKLKPEYIQRIVDQGAKERPYMLTRMPGFGPQVAQSVTPMIVQLDRQPATESDSTKSDSKAANEKVIAAGRKLVGNDGLACIKCHTFGEKATPGIQAIDMQRMTERLNPDWFHRYMLNPTQYRPGTRMPLSFPDGKSVLTSVFDGNADQQIDAMWDYLTQGSSAREPVGLDGQSIVLQPKDRPVIYRNFIEGVSPRGIAVGYPAQCNLAWDAEKMSLAFIWKNGFIDAAKHWVGRGPGNQKPLGDFLVNFESSAPLAILSSANEAWPTETARSRGVNFKGYRLNAAGEPTFRYSFGQVEVEDAPLPFASADNIGFSRTLKVSIKSPTSGIVFRAATGKIAAVENGYLVNDKVKIVVTGVDLKLIEVNGGQELRASLPDSGEVTITEQILW